MPLTSAQLDRYARHLVLKEIGGAGQQKLMQAKVLVIGAGGLGAPLLAYLAGAGVGTLGIIDDDTVSLSNLQRQILFRTDQIEVAKTEAAEKYLSALNPDCTIQSYPQRLTAQNALELISQYDVIADGSDNFATRLLVNDACYFAKKPLISAAVGRFEGQLSCFKPFETDPQGNPNPCYRSLVPENPNSADDNLDSCAELGVVGALTGIMGSLQALEVIKEITGAGENLVSKLLIYDGLTHKSRIVSLAWDPENPLNGAKPTLKDLSHHQD